MAAVTADRAVTRKPVLTLYRQRPAEVGVPSENPKLNEPGLVISDFVDRVGIRRISRPPMEPCTAARCWSPTRCGRWRMPPPTVGRCPMRSP